MKIITIIKRAVAPLALLLPAAGAHAQYYEIANQLPSLLRPALSGSFNYKGFVDAGYNKTLGDYNADFLEISTSQGFQYSNWFFMGVGIGVDVLFAQQNDNHGYWEGPDGFDHSHSSCTTAAMMPLFTDFRFSLGYSSAATFFIDLKVGCSFLLGNDYIAIGDGYLTNQEYFYLHPSIGLRIPTNPDNTKQAFNIGLNYKLLTSNYWSSWERNITLNGIGVTVAYEW